MLSETSEQIALRSARLVSALADRASRRFTITYKEHHPWADKDWRVSLQPDGFSGVTVTGFGPTLVVALEEAASRLDALGAKP